jgi:YtkA-like
MSRIALVVLLAFGVLAGTAQAGGWATVELGEPVPSDLSAGTPWKVELIVKQHGITPLDDVTPSVEITNAAGATKTFQATHAGKPGTYVTEVTFPSGGEWNTRLYDGFTDATPHRLKPLEVAPAGGAAAGGGGSDFPWPQAIAGAVIALIFLTALVLTFDRPRLRARAGSVRLRGRAA